MELSEVPESIDWSNYLNRMHDYCAGRCLITTEKGYIGLAPKNSKVGDIVCILLGCRSPLVLRPLSEAQYQIVGECCICGLMDGEALLGPLPSHVERFQRLDDEFGWWSAFIDRETGEISVHDPRVGPLPEGWGFKKHAEERAWNR